MPKRGGEGFKRNQTKHQRVMTSLHFKVFFSVQMLLLLSIINFMLCKRKAKILCFLKDTGSMGVEVPILHSPALFYRMNFCSDYTSCKCTGISPPAW